VRQPSTTAPPVVSSSCDNQSIVPTLHRLSLLFLAATLTSLGCHAQTPAAGIVVGSPLSPALEHKVEVLLRQKAQLPPGSTIGIGPAQPSEVPGFSTIAVSFTSIEGTPSHSANFLISNDGKTVAQFTKYDISADPRALISPDGRPARGGPAAAPVLIVGFDDLECPYCARLHESIFPAITQRYGDKVRIVYKDFPLDQHPWALRAAVDVNCLGAQSPAGYWTLVDYIHAHATDVGSDPNAKPTPSPDSSQAAPPAEAPPDKTLDRANAQLDKLTREQGKAQKADAPKLEACIAKQDTTAIDASKQIATALNVDSTPSLFINGEKIDGAVPIDFIFHIIDDSLRAANVTPPPPYVIPTPSIAPTPNHTK
jgi:protein-disulfide isomerase